MNILFFVCGEPSTDICNGGGGVGSVGDGDHGGGDGGGGGCCIG